MDQTEKVRFSVDAGIINRLGMELVSRSETAVSELIKNSYDADANKVTVSFIGAQSNRGGTLIIDDDGLGMSREQLINGFMRLATSDKLHRPISSQFNRPKAGKKGIGRFATQRLGKKLTILTQTDDSVNTLKLTILWDDYKIDTDIYDITNLLEFIPKQKTNGTTLIIEDLRESWTDQDIKRVYRYVSELIQPNLLKIDKQLSIVEFNNKEAFEVEFFGSEKSKPIADVQNMMLDRAILTINGFIDERGFGYCNISSKKIDLKDTIKIGNTVKNKEVKLPFSHLIGSKVIFQVYYFIVGNKSDYYYENITKPELNAVKNNLEKNGGIKLYRNGFKVSPYGDQHNDWLGISRKSRIGGGVPFSNNNLIGLVQINDENTVFFEEVAGREGIIETEAFKSLQTFVSLAIESGFRNFVSKFKNSPEYILANQKSSTNVTTSSVRDTVTTIQQATETLASPDKSNSEKQEAQTEINKAVRKLVEQTNTVADELEMLRVLAGVGLTIGEFIHEIKQFSPSFSGHISSLMQGELSKEIKETLTEMQKVFTSFQSYTSYFDATISQNVIRELQNIDARDVIRDFKKIALPDLQRRDISLELEFNGWDLISCPMHISEWNTILQNLYSNAKKAIYRKGVKGEILIKSYKEQGKLIVSFLDNGSGIQEKYRDRIFDAFFTTSTPFSNNGLVSEDMTGSGLGLHIVKQIILNRNGNIWVDTPYGNFSTCITIQLPLMNPENI